MSDLPPILDAPWFFMERLPAPGADGRLPQFEARHAIGARRLGEGDVVTLFDGRGRVARARLGALAGPERSRGLRIECVEEREAPSPEVTLATAVPKGDRWPTLLDMAGQLGASRIVPLDCERSVVRSGSLNRERAGRILVEACKQARRAWVPELGEPRSPAEAARLGRTPAGGVTFMAIPGVTPLRTLLEAVDPTAPLTILIGPEGGFTEAEIHAGRAFGAVPAALGPSILRVETACVTALALVRAR